MTNVILTEKDVYPKKRSGEMADDGASPLQVTAYGDGVNQPLSIILRPTLVIYEIPDPNPAEEGGVM